MGSSPHLSSARDDTSCLNGQPRARLVQDAERMPRRHAPLPSTLSTPFAYAEARAMGVTAGRLRGSDLERPFHATRILTDPATRSAFAGPQAIDARVLRDAVFHLHRLVCIRRQDFSGDEREY